MLEHLSFIPLLSINAIKIIHTKNGLAYTEHPSDKIQYPNTAIRPKIHELKKRTANASVKIEKPRYPEANKVEQKLFIYSLWIILLKSLVLVMTDSYMPSPVPTTCKGKGRLKKMSKPL
jgi:hypothetical protein